MSAVSRDTGSSNPRCQLGITDLSKDRKPGCSEAKTGCLGSCTIKDTRNTPPFLPASHSRFWKRIEGWRFSLQGKSKTKCKNRFAEQYAEMERSQDNFYRSEMLKHLPEQIRVLQTTSEVFTRIRPDNSLERLTECGVGLVTDQSSDFWELFVTPFK